MRPTTGGWRSGAVAGLTHNTHGTKVGADLGLCRAQSVDWLGGRPRRGTEWDPSAGHVDDMNKRDSWSDTIGAVRRSHSPPSIDEASQQCNQRSNPMPLEKKPHSRCPARREGGRCLLTHTNRRQQGGGARNKLRCFSLLLLLPPPSSRPPPPAKQ